MCTIVVRIDKKPPVTTIILDNPAVKNAVDGPTASALADAFREFETEKSAKVAVLWGDHGCFCSGANIKAINEGRGNRVEKDGDGPMGPTRMLLSKPVLAAIAGYAVGGGFELALWCDLRIAEQSAIFGFFNRRWGIPLADGGTIRLPRMIGLSNALDLILTGRPVKANEASRMGIVNRIVKNGESRHEAEKLALTIARFPQTCLREDRLSTYEQVNLKLESALKNEYFHALKSLKEIDDGVKRYIHGEGRHGEF